MTTAIGQAHAPGWRSRGRLLSASEGGEGGFRFGNYLPFHSFQANAAWFELALCAHDTMIWTQLLCLDGEHRICEPKRLRYRILHVAGQLTRHARRTTLHLPADWP